MRRTKYSRAAGRISVAPAPGACVPQRNFGRLHVKLLCQGRATELRMNTIFNS